MIRLGLCCLFRDEPIRFRTATATATARLPRADQLAKLASRIDQNARALEESIQAVARLGFGAFRVNSQILPLKTHPDIGYAMEDLPNGEHFVRAFKRCGRLARSLDVRLSFHPDQFVVLSSPRPEVVTASLMEIEYQAEVASWIGADVINVHAGGIYGDKTAALARLEKNLKRLSRRARMRLTLENDDRSYTPSDLLPLCERGRIPLCYDAHHHRCLPDGLSVDEATLRAIATWNREPLFHLSSPRDGWKGAHPSRHHDYVSVRDFPSSWMDLDLTVDIEAKAKERALRRLRRSLARRGVEFWSGAS